MTAFEFGEPLLTERLRLRLETEADIDDVFGWMSDPDVARYQLYEPRDRATVTERVREAAVTTQLAQDGQWADTGVYAILASEWVALAQERVLGAD